MKIIDCKSIAQKWKDEVKSTGVDAGLCVIQVGNDPASSAYIKGKKKDCEEVGFRFEHIHILNADEGTIRKRVRWSLIEQGYLTATNGCILQLPLPEGVTLDFKIELCLPNDKDVDGFNPESKFKPCTPEAVMELLNEIGVDPAGKHVVIAGRSDIVGKPLAQMMSEADATVTICHSKTPTEVLYKMASEADIFVAAVGKPGLIESNVFKDGAVVIDVGINRTENGLCGDVKIVGNTKNIMITPVPGGVGLLTRAMLMKHVLKAYELQHPCLTAKRALKSGAEWADNPVLAQA